MNDEIKEILDKMFLNCDTQEEKNKVLDYITNLQQENKKISVQHLETVNKLIEVQSRIEKAVEYIQNCPEYLWENVNTKELLNILNGRSDE